MSVGASLDLYGIIGSNASAEASQFEWSVSSETYLTLNKTDGQYVTVTLSVSHRTILRQGYIGMDR